MQILAQTDTLQSGVSALEEAGRTILNFLPTFVGFLVILIVGYFVAKAIAKVLNKVLERAGFDRAVERGGVKKALERSHYDASGVLSKLVFYAIFLFVLQLAFGVFGPNPISELLTGVIAFLPKIFVAILILVIAAAIAAGAREIVSATLGGLSYGNVLANVASAAILFVGVIAALNQVEIAPEIVNGIFYAVLAVIAGSAIVAIGGGGIQPMREQWQRVMNRVEEEAPLIKEEVANTSKEDLRARAEQRRDAYDDQTSVRPGSSKDRTVVIPQDEDTRR